MEIVSVSVLVLLTVYGFALLLKAIVREEERKKERSEIAWLER